jgi:hypothetical protein
MSDMSFIHILSIPQTFFSMRVMFNIELIRKQEIVVDLEAFVEG